MARPVIAVALALAAAAAALCPPPSQARSRLQQLTGAGRLQHARAAAGAGRSGAQGAVGGEGAGAPAPSSRWRTLRGAARRVTPALTGARAESGLPDVVRAVRLLAQELAGGADPARAWSGAAEVGGRARRWLGAVAAQAAAGEPVGDALALAAARLADEDPAAAHTVRRLGIAWGCGAGTGSSAAEVAMQWVRDAEDAARARAALDSHLAGPRASALLLAALPLLGLGMGTAMGADPIGTLLGGPAGLVLLCLGAALEVLGICWVRRIVRAAATA